MLCRELRKCTGERWRNPVRRIGAVTFAVAAVCAAEGTMERSIDVRVTMRDGVKLSTNVFRPPGTGRWPALLIRTPYDKGDDLLPTYRLFIDNGYAVVVQDVRGRYDSEGLFEPMVQEGPDGEDTLYWIGHQPWSDGKVGMLGGSYVGIVQWQAALRGSPYLKAIFPLVSGFDDYYDRFYSRGGAMKWGHRLMWIAENLRAPGFKTPDFNRFIYHLPERTADRAVAGRTVEWYQHTLNHPSYDEFWRKLSTRQHLDRVKVPVFAMGGWFDNYGQSDLEAFAELRRLGRTAHVAIGPWAHNFSEKLAIDFGPESALPVRRMQLAWFDHWLKGRDTIANLPPARIFTMGENKWHDLTEWPPGDSILTMYLGGKKKANSVFGSGTLEARQPVRASKDEFVYDPRKPVPTRGGPICCNVKVLPPGPMEQKTVEGRNDVLVYTSPALVEDTEVTGVIRALLYISTSAPDTDFTAKLVDVAPDGSAMSVTDGILRLRYRHGTSRPQLVQPDKVYPVQIDVGSTSIAFRAGHRIRLEVSSSNFPRFDRNPNTGRPIADELELRIARQTVYRGGRYPSMLVLPVVRRHSSKLGALHSRLALGRAASTESGRSSATPPVH